MRHGVVRATSGHRFYELHGPEPLPPSVGIVEQSNTSIRYGNHLILKLFRRQEAGPNPDCEIGRFLTEQGQFDRLPPFVGAIDYLADGAEPATLASSCKTTSGQPANAISFASRASNSGSSS